MTAVLFVLLSAVAVAQSVLLALLMRHLIGATERAATTDLAVAEIAGFLREHIEDHIKEAGE